MDEEVKVEDTTLFTWERLCTEVALSVKNVNARARTVTERMSTLTYCDFHCIILNTGSSCAHVKSSKHCACVGERGGMLEVYAPSPLTLMIMEEEDSSIFFFVILLFIIIYFFIIIIISKKLK